MKNKDPENIIKGRIAESIAEEMFKELGFFILRLGKENTVNPLTQMENFVKSCSGKFSLEKLDDKIKEITQVNTLPDFFIVHPNGKTSLLEVKFRWNGYLYPHDELVFNTYPETEMLILNLQPKDNFVSFENEEDKKILEKELNNSRFHIWFIEDCSDPEENLICVSLERWLKDKFDIENTEILKKYADLTKRWLGNEEVFRKNE